MSGGAVWMEHAYSVFFLIALVFLAVMVFLCLIRAIIGPRIADRIVAINMMSTMVLVMIGILTIMLQEGYLADICLIYAMISFLAVIVLTKVYMGVYVKRMEDKQKEEKKQEEVQHGSSN